MLKKILLLLTLLLSAVAAFAEPTPAPQADTEIASYVVTLRDGSADGAASIAVMYGGKLERRDAGSFTLRISAARARRLASDPRVLTVVGASSGRAVVEGAEPKVLGSYVYDGAGNIQAIGDETFAYDLAGRLTDALLTRDRQTFSYDAFGNRTTADTTGDMKRCNRGADCHDAPAVEVTTNRISGAGYDVAGNLTSYAGRAYAYDPLDMMTSESTGDLQFVYTADDERIAVYNNVQWKWAIRDAQAHVVREFTSPASAPANWTWTNDNVFRGALLLASDGPDGGRRHYHLDHLGTARLITDDYGRTVGEYEYYPFGTDPDSNTREVSAEESLKFTGHQRDIAAGDLHVLDYMHARYYDGAVGRFLSVDPKASWNPAVLQSWNRYSYAANNPLKYIDTNGREIKIAVNRRSERLIDVNVRLTVEVHWEDGLRPRSLEFASTLQVAANILGGTYKTAGGNTVNVRTTIDTIFTENGGTDASRHQLALIKGMAEPPMWYHNTDKGGKESIMNEHMATAKFVAHEFAHWLGLDDPPEPDRTTDVDPYLGNLMDNRDGSGITLWYSQWLEIQRMYRAGELNTGIKKNEK